MSKFAAVPLDPDTRIINSSETNLAGIAVLHQRWTWEGVIAESLVFATDDVQSMSDADLKALTVEGGYWDEDSRFTFKRSDDFTFVNFNFEVPC